MSANPSKGCRVPPEDSPWVINKSTGLYLTIASSISTIVNTSPGSDTISTALIPGNFYIGKTLRINVFYKPFIFEICMVLFPQNPLLAISICSPGSTRLTSTVSSPPFPVTWPARVTLFFVWNTYFNISLMSNISYKFLLLGTSLKRLSKYLIHNRIYPSNSRLTHGVQNPWGTVWRSCAHEQDVWCRKRPFAGLDAALKVQLLRTHLEQLALQTTNTSGSSYYQSD